MRASVIGCGRWGTFLAWYLDRLGHSTRLYGREGSRHMQALMQTRSNGLITLPETVELTCTLDDDAEAYFISVDS